MQRSLNRKLVVAVAALAAIAFAGGAYAATQSSTPNVRQAFLNDVARRLGVTPARLHSALAGAFDDQLKLAVAQGRLSRARAAVIKRRAQRLGMVPLGALLGRTPAFRAKRLARARRMIDRLAAAKLISARQAQELRARLDRRSRRTGFRWLFAPRPVP